MTDVAKADAFGKVLNQPTFTAVPIGVHAWAVKAVSPAGDETRIGRFDGRLKALGAAVLLAARAEGRVLP